jgi:O-antigen ligase
MNPAMTMDSRLPHDDRRIGPVASGDLACTSRSGWSVGEILLTVYFMATIVRGESLSHIGTGPWFITDSVLISLVALALILQPQHFFAWGRVEGALVAFFGLAVLHTLAALDHGFFALKDATLAGYALFALLVPTFIRSWVGVRRILLCAAIATGVRAVVAVLGPSIGGNSAFFLGAGAVALVAGLALKIRWTGVFLFCCYIVGVALSGRRAPALALVVAVIVLAVSLPRPARHRTMQALMAIAVCGFLLFQAAGLVGVLSDRLDAGLERYRSGTVRYQEDPTAQWRLATWRNAVDLLVRSPIRGVGFGEPINVYADVRPRENPNPYNDGLPHNTYLTVALRMGIPGVSCLAIVLVTWFRRMWRLRFRSPLAPVILTTTVYGCVYGFFGLFLERPFMAMFFWCVVGLGLTLDRLVSAEMLTGMDGSKTQGPGLNVGRASVP